MTVCVFADSFFFANFLLMLGKYALILPVTQYDVIMIEYVKDRIVGI